MRISRARFKYTLRQCRLEERTICSNKLAFHTHNHDVNQFWKEIKKHGKSNTSLSNCINNVTGEHEITEL